MFAKVVSRPAPPRTAEGFTSVDIAHPLGAFGEVATIQPTPVVQIDGVFGKLVGMHEHTLEASASVSVANALITASTGADVNAWARAETSKHLRYRPGQGARARFTALWPSGGVADSTQLAGCLGQTDALVFGFDGAAFGILHRYGGKVEIQTFTFTVGAGGAENATVTLDGVDTVVGLTNGNVKHAAYELAQATYTGWDVFHNDDTVVFYALDPVAEVKVGAFTFASTGTATATIVQTQAGVVPTDDWTAQADFNVDKLDGTGPSQLTLDPTNGNVFEIIFQYLGFGGITFAIEDPSTSRFVPVHKLMWANENAFPTLGNPNFHIGVEAYSLGSTTDLIVSTASIAGLVDGVVLPFENPRGTSASTPGITTQVAVLLLRVRALFGGVALSNEINLQRVMASVDGVKAAIVKVVVNPTITGEPDWQYIDEAASIVEYATDSVTIANGQEVGTLVIAGSDSDSLVLKNGGAVKLQHQDVLCVAALLTGGAGSEVTVATLWSED